MGEEKNKNRCWLKADDEKQGIIFPFVVLAIWQAISVAGIANPILMPSPASILGAAAEMLKSGELVRHLEISFIRVIEGFFIASALALVLASAMGIFTRIFSLLNMTIQLLRPVPPIAWIPLAILWFGIEEGSKVFIIVLGSFFPIFTNVLGGIRQTENKFVELAKALQIPQRKFIMKVVVPGTLPFIVTGLRTGLGYAWMCVVAAELSAGMQGIGYMLTDARAMIQTDRIIVGMLAIGVIGKGMDSLLLLLEERIIKGKEFYTGNE
ncbi:MAG: ssuC 11 [Firmicutes bacterium]|nr:ssuC 11 [Bacillota bacterium]